MAIVQRNLYLPGQDLTNLAQNVDFNRFQDFKGTITVNFGTVPATVTVKVGTILEVNGNLYAIETADYVFQMDNATHNYLTFTDNPAVDFGSAAAIGTYTAAKQGYYQAGNVIRTLPFYVNQTSQEYRFLIDDSAMSLINFSNKFDYIKVKTDTQLNANALIHLNTIIFDEFSNWDTVAHKFTCVNAGYYLVLASLGKSLGVGTVQIRMNNVTVASGSLSNVSHSSVIMHLNVTDYITVWAAIADGQNSSTDGDKTFCCLTRLF